MIYNVISPLKHNGIYYPDGSFIEGDEEAFPELVAHGVLAPVPNASNTDEAQAILAAQAGEAAQAEVAAEAAQPKNTWGPQSDPVTEPEPEAVPEEQDPVPSTVPQEPKATSKNKKKGSFFSPAPADETGDNL